MSTSDDQRSPEEQFAALLPPEQQEALQAQAVERMMSQPIALPTMWNAGPGNSPDGPIVVLDIRTPAGSLRVVLPRDAALQFASEIRKVAQTGPQLQIAHPGQVPGL